MDPTGIPLLEKKMPTARTRTAPDKDTEHHDESHHGSRCYNVVTDFISLTLGIVEISLVLYLSASHFSHSQGVIAIAMLAPILLNFVGVTYFLSDKEERTIFEKSGTTRCAKDLFQVPVLGPIFTSIKVLLLSCGISKQQANYHRFEASSIKMRQAESFFGCAPEALVQLTVFLTMVGGNLTLDNYLEISVVVVSVINLSEANMYAFISNYYRLFHSYKPDDWKMPPLMFWQKSILFLHAFFSIGSRIAAMASLKAAVKYYVINDSAMMMSMRANQAPPVGAGTGGVHRTSPGAHAVVNGTSPGGHAIAAGTGTGGHATAASSDSERLGYYIAMFFLCEIGFRMLFYYIARALKYWYKKKEIPSGCYESINYGWRATILDLGYQSKNVLVQIWFYTENSLCFIIWWVSIARIGREDANVLKLKDSVLVPLTIIFVLFTIISVFMLFACAGLRLHTLRGPYKKSTHANRSGKP